MISKIAAVRRPALFLCSKDFGHGRSTGHEDDSRFPFLNRTGTHFSTSRLIFSSLHRIRPSSTIFLSKLLRVVSSLSHAQGPWSKHQVLVLRKTPGFLLGSND